MFEVKLYYATVIDNDDQNHDDGEKKGRVQIQVLPEMQEIDTDYLPWVEPFFNSGFGTAHSYNSPEIDDKIWVLFTDKYWKRGYYLTGAFINGIFDHSTIENLIGNLNEDVDTTYPNLKFFMLPDQSLLFWNVDTNEKGFINNNGWYFLIDTDGKTYLYFANQEMKIYGDKTELYIEDDGTVTLTTQNDVNIINDKVTTNLKNTGDVQISNDGITFDLKNDGTYKIDGSGDIECTATGQIKINGTNLTVDV